MLHRASLHSFSPAAASIESTATVKFVTSKCGCCSRRNGPKLSSSPLLRAGYLNIWRTLFPPLGAFGVYRVRAVSSPVFHTPVPGTLTQGTPAVLLAPPPG
ncbi:hypothetical protein PBY51_000433 [Eleginops maclovinus]|uniref:Uncharacterized protein n=1 Tax=Eleginops maclovinus TaxID=56733 RepID=A0AAN7XHH5_ELEMC|nr:hypothetical protein PBY51_000433 [Eleginops maclovinus]